jgi:hypothetical protein
MTIRKSPISLISTVKKKDGVVVRQAVRQAGWQAGWQVVDLVWPGVSIASKGGDQIRKLHPCLLQNNVRLTLLPLTADWGV